VPPPTVLVDAYWRSDDGWRPGELPEAGGIVRTVAIIQARLGSTRFPRKALAELNGSPLIAHVVARVLRVCGIAHVVVACPGSDTADIAEALNAFERDQVTVEWVERQDDDVLGRFADIAAGIPAATAFARFTGDCPLLDPHVSSLVLERFFEERADFASNDVNESGYPDGTDTEVFTRELLERAHREATSAYDREHVTPIMKRLPGVRSVLVHNMNPKYQPDPKQKWSVDTPEDLARVAEYLRTTATGRTVGR
jgi:spore coat polysaccharide biosynthesis protein SpsF (cytidylyltransferase family)